jgi:hypothetical protein
MGGMNCSAVYLYANALMIDGQRPFDQQCVSKLLVRGVAPSPTDVELARAASGYFISLVNAFTNCRDVKGRAWKISSRVS